MLCIFFQPQYYNGYTKFHQLFISFFKYRLIVTAVTIQSNKVVGNKVKTNKRYYSHLTEKNRLFGQPKK